MAQANVNRETFIRQIKKWQLELNESLAEVRQSGENGIAKALQNCLSTLAMLMSSLEENSNSFPKDFWTGDSSDTKMNQMVDQVVARISNLKLPIVSKKKEAHIARRRD